MSATPTLHEAVVVRRVDWSEADRIITLVTRDMGKVAALARGVRRSRSRLGPHLDLLAHVDVELVAGRGSLLVVTAAKVRDRSVTSAHPAETAAMALVVELVDGLTVDAEPIDASVMDLLVAGVSPHTDGIRPRWAIWTITHLLIALGYAPRLEECAECGHTLLAEEGHRFVAGAGGVVCPNCASARRGDVVPLSLSALKVMRVAARGDAQMWGRISLSSELLAQVVRALSSLVEFHSSRQLKSAPVLIALLPPD